MTNPVSTTTSISNQVKIKTSIIGNESVNSVDARELHAFLGSGKQFADWVKNKVVDSPFFQEDIDYVLLHQSVKQTGSGGHNRKDYALTQDTAKKVSMAEQTVKGNEARDYFLLMEKKAKGISLPASPISSRVEDLKATIEMANIFGLKGNQALLSANTAIKKIHDFDCMETLGITHLISENQVQYFTPTVLGKEVGLSAVKMNKAIESAGFQTMLRDGKNRIVWEATEAGKAHCQLLNTNKKHSDGTPIEQIKWGKSVLEMI